MNKPSFQPKSQKEYEKILHIINIDEFIIFLPQNHQKQAWEKYINNILSWLDFENLELLHQILKICFLFLAVHSWENTEDIKKLSFDTRSIFLKIWEKIGKNLEKNYDFSWLENYNFWLDNEKDILVSGVVSNMLILKDHLAASNLKLKDIKQFFDIEKLLKILEKLTWNNS